MAMFLPAMKAAVANVDMAFAENACPGRSDAGLQGGQANDHFKVEPGEYWPAMALFSAARADWTIVLPNR